MKTLILLTILFCTVLGGLYSPEQAVLFETAFKECYEITQVERDLIAKMIHNRQVPDAVKVEDFSFCVYKKTGFMKEDGTVDKVFSQKFGDTFPPRAKAVLSQCVDAVASVQEGSTGSQTAYRLAKCYLESLPTDLIINVEV